MFHGRRVLQCGGLFCIIFLQVCDEVFMGYLSGLFEVTPRLLDACIDIVVPDKRLQLVVGDDVGRDEVDGKPDVLCIVQGQAKIHI